MKNSQRIAVRFIHDFGFSVELRTLEDESQNLGRGKEGRTRKTNLTKIYFISFQKTIDLIFSKSNCSAKNFSLYQCCTYNSVY